MVTFVFGNNRCMLGRAVARGDCVPNGYVDFPRDLSCRDERTIYVSTQVGAACATGARLRRSRAECRNSYQNSGKQEHRKSHYSYAFY